MFAQKSSNPLAMKAMYQIPGSLDALV